MLHSPELFLVERQGNAYGCTYKTPASRYRFVRHVETSEDWVYRPLSLLVWREERNESISYKCVEIITENDTLC